MFGPRIAAVAIIVSGALVLPAQAASGTTVLVKDDLFSPSSKTIRKGSTVTFKWKGKSVHDVVAKRGSKTVFRISLRTKGTVSKRFSKAGTYKLICSIHTPNMKATIKVR
jgi:plastocyanin